MSEHKCRFPDGIVVKPDGVNELEACLYSTREIHRNVTVEVRKCKRCGNVDICWIRQENTEDEYIEDDGEFENPALDI